MRADTASIATDKTHAPVESVSSCSGTVSYRWSWDGRWLALRVLDRVPAGWDEVPVGGPTLQHRLAVFDGATGAEHWNREVDTVWAPFEWTSDGLLDAAEAVWNPESGEPLSPRGRPG